jgi:hypothetical protein
LLFRSRNDKILKVLKGIDTLFHVVEVSDKAVDDIFNLIKE